jgi:hypothetical protein
LKHSSAGRRTGFLFQPVDHAKSWKAAEMGVDGQHGGSNAKGATGHDDVREREDHPLTESIHQSGMR